MGADHPYLELPLNRRSTSSGRTTTILYDKHEMNATVVVMGTGMQQAAAAVTVPVYAYPLDQFSVVFASDFSHVICETDWAETPDADGSSHSDRQSHQRSECLSALGSVADDLQIFWSS